MDAKITNGFHSTWDAIIPKCSKKHKNCTHNIFGARLPKNKIKYKNVVHKKNAVHNTLGAMVVVALCRSV